MPFPLRTAVTGLLELLKLKTLGRAPEWFGESVQPMIDTRMFYASNILETQAGPQTVGAFPNLTDSLTLPAAFGLHAIGGAITVGAAGGTNMCIAVAANVRTLLVSVPLYNFFVPSFVAAQVIEFGTPIPGLVLPAGTRIFARVSATAAGADHAVNVAALIEDYSNL